MPRNARCVEPGLAYHVTQRGTNHQRVFFSDADRKAYLGLVGDQLDDARVRVLAWCLMDNHVHWIVIPDQEDSLAVLFRRVHGRYAQMVNARRRRTGHLWQSRFFSCPLEGNHLRRALAYVERNPVRAGLAARPEDYRWSSAAAHLGLRRDREGLLDWDCWRELGGAQAWRELLMTPDDLAQLRVLRRCTYAGRPYGGEEFLRAMEERFGRKWRRWKFEGAGQAALEAGS
jgi:putative transposase